MIAPAEWPRWAFMWLLAAGIFAGCKWLTWRRTPVRNVPWWQHLGYLIAWPGLDAKSFLNSERLPANKHPTSSEWLAAVLKLLIGVTLFGGVARWLPIKHEILFGWIGMFGLILMLHFGAFHLLSCAWRSLGINAQPLMKAPLASTSVSEFWGRRWNTAFRDFTYRFLFRPLSSRLGPSWAVLIGFIFSGLIHDFVISVPAGDGFGWPTLFFGTQAIAIFLERSSVGRAIALGRGWKGRLFAMLILVVPAYGLFHPPFVLKIILPFMHALGVR
ncbi:MAG TPA: MBOAT family protein [Pyrinomonadaceae bacterium]|nr:MBOAT family protein [Pyrinomonadaceae bacterium]